MANHFHVNAYRVFLSEGEGCDVGGVRDVEKDAAMVSGGESWLAFWRIGEAYFGAFNAQVACQQLAQARPRNDETTPVLGKQKAVRALDFIGRKKMFKVSCVVFRLKISTPNPDFASQEKEPWIRV
jgi:hypothetical protein